MSKPDFEKFLKGESTHCLDKAAYTAADKEGLIRLMSNFETRSSKDIQFLMRMAFEAGKGEQHKDFDSYLATIKRMLDL